MFWTNIAVSKFARGQEGACQGVLGRRRYTNFVSDVIRGLAGPSRPPLLLQLLTQVIERNLELFEDNANRVAVRESVQ